MVRLTLLLYSFISATMAGIFIVAVLAAGYGTQMPIIYAAAAGFALALPASWVIAKMISNQR